MILAFCSARFYSIFFSRPTIIQGAYTPVPIRRHNFCVPQWYFWSAYLHMSPISLIPRPHLIPIMPFWYRVRADGYAARHANIVSFFGASRRSFYIHFSFLDFAPVATSGIFTALVFCADIVYCNCHPNATLSFVLLESYVSPKFCADSCRHGFYLLWSPGIMCFPIFFIFIRVQLPSTRRALRCAEGGRRTRERANSGTFCFYK